MRILFLNPSGHLGGAERCLLDLIASIRGYAPTRAAELGLVAAGDGLLLSEAEALGVHVVRLPLGARLAALGDSTLRAPGPRAAAELLHRMAAAAGDAPLYARRLRKVVSEFRPTVVHSNGIKMHLLAASVGVGAPLVWHVRDFLGDRPLVSRALRLVAWRADAAIAISRAVADDTKKIVPRLPVSVVHDAIDTDVFSPDGRRADLDRLAGAEAAPSGVVRVGLVATYARWKGHETFLEAARLLSADAGGRDVRFYVVGGPIYDAAAWQFSENELRAMVRDLGLQQRVKFVPFQNRVEEVFRALDVVVHASSRREPFGRTIAEAMATGKAVIASRESGAAELFDDGVNALSFPPRNSEALAGGLRDLIADPARRQALGRAARDTAVERFSRARLASQVLDVYRGVRMDKGALHA
jgi:glycosyltransferase involved in cell wall biosynthesis